MRIFLTTRVARQQPAMRLWIDLEAPLPAYHAFVVRCHYRDLRNAGMPPFRARRMIYELLSTGRFIKLGECYA